ncbi:MULTISPECIES: sulfur carrier protein ThiS [Salimicrobium]|uniref:Sulfur carrier protein ThiS n=3 Tax=Salimicrobium TaxID=351195 RepID=K2H9L7_9BACI|nr:MULTISPECIES: sulfur carrier protein ThiS [Salimicrobium]AKG05249.1 thiamine biosynthesis protein ThiS [Salimicrobium jeotgali]EKE32365.1 sulfur carrier protein ThiS [Salimicrobium jeotgali]MBM7695660.1 sulfur carrier protein [Salimicrobium jeotgali]SDY10234.1 sulfur carrier protein [Salimicrobium album]SIS75288.1 sulfur carrier protein [Salimicrobium salexigens]
MELLINGTTVQLSNNITTVSDVIDYFIPDRPAVVVEHNGNILTKENHSTVNVKDGDKIELVNFVGGG